MTESGALAFSIAFDDADEDEVLRRWRDLLRSNRWTEGGAVEEFESAWQDWNGLPSVAFSSWSGAALGALDYFGVRGEKVLCPSNTFQATPLAIAAAGGEPVFYDCNRADLCGSFEDFVRKAEIAKPRAAWIVHIGGHIAFDIEKIAAYCRDKNIWLAEDCAHAHGAEWNGRKPGSWGDVGIYSFYPTKTISSGEGGLAVSRHPQMIAHLRSYRDYGKSDPSGPKGLNFRMTEFAAILAAVQTRRMPQIVAWKRAYAEQVLMPQFPTHMRMPEGLKSGYYKFIVLGKIEPSTGRVYQTPCHRMFGDHTDLPNSDWVADNHSCVPLYYPRNARQRDLARAVVA